MIATGRAQALPGPVAGVGLDIVDVEEVADALARHGDRYLERVFTSAELRECGRHVRRLAACIAVKEATMKALRVGRQAMPWTAISLAHDERGEPRIVLAGAATERASARGVTQLRVSVTVRRGAVTAVVVVA